MELPPLLIEDRVSSPLIDADCRYTDLDWLSTTASISPCSSASLSEFELEFSPADEAQPLEPSTPIASFSQPEPTFPNQNSDDTQSVRESLPEHHTDSQQPKRSKQRLHRVWDESVVACFEQALRTFKSPTPTTIFRFMKQASLHGLLTADIKWLQRSHVASRLQRHRRANRQLQESASAAASVSSSSQPSSPDSTAASVSCRTPPVSPTNALRPLSPAMSGSTLLPSSQRCKTLAPIAVRPAPVSTGWPQLEQLRTLATSANSGFVFFHPESHCQPLLPATTDRPSLLQEVIELQQQLGALQKLQALVDLQQRSITRLLQRQHDATQQLQQAELSQHVLSKKRRCSDDFNVPQKRPREHDQGVRR